MLNQTITLPKGATFNGIGEINAAQGGLITGRIDDAINIWPFTAEIEFPPAIA
jgi:hypothetical protein